MTTTIDAGAWRPQFSVCVPDTATATTGPIRRNAFNATSQLTVQGGCRSAYESFRNGGLASPGGACLGWRPIDSDGAAGPYCWMSYSEALSRVGALHAGLSSRGAFAPNADGMPLLALYMKNCPEWVLCEQACFASRGATVPLYDTLGPEVVDFVLRQTGSACVVCGGAAEAKAVLELLRPRPAPGGSPLPRLKLVVVVDPLADLAALRRMASGSGGYGGCVEVVGLGAVEGEGVAMGRDKWPLHAPPAPNDVATFCYTSGTTGDPKGALITHANLIAAAANLEVGDFDPFGPGDVHFSYLPLPHIFERIVEVACFSAGAAVGFFQGSALKVVEDLVALRPTIFPSVPRVLNKVHDKIKAGVAAAGGGKASLFNRALEAKLGNLHARGQLTHWLWDKLVFGKVKAGLGLDRVRFVVTGSAPISPKVHDFFRVLLGIQVYEGYGQTEGTGVATISARLDLSAGHVGPPLPCIEMRLEDVPDMGYLHTDAWHGSSQAQSAASSELGVPCLGRGEVCYRGPCTFKGYYQLPLESKEMVDADGWLHSGDVGMWTLEGNLRIIDRKKNIFKLAQGEYVAAEKIENVLTSAPLIAQAFVYGDSLQSYLVAVVVPDEDACAARFGPGSCSAAACADVASPLRSAVAAEMAMVCGQARLAGFELVKGFHLDPKPFTVEEGLLTPTFKLKRQVAQRKYQQVLDALYARGPDKLVPALARL